MAIDLSELLLEPVARLYVGFSAASRSVKPVHIANGLYRILLDRIADTELLNRVTFYQKDSGEVPPGHGLDEVYQRLIDGGRLDRTAVTSDDIAQFRVLLKKVLSADDGVFMYRDRMASYSAASANFVSNNRIAQEGGEFVGAWLRHQKSLLAARTIEHLTSRRDTVTVLCMPLLQSQFSSATSAFDYRRVRVLSGEVGHSAARSWDGLALAANTLGQHLDPAIMPDNLSALRLAVLFASFVIVRHLANLEAAYVPKNGKERPPPFLIDFSESEAEPVARASTYSYIRLCQALARFYSWGLGQGIRERHVEAELRPDTPPKYKSRIVGPPGRESWQMACVEADASEDPYTVLGQALFDILAREAEGNPVTYLRQLGHRAGLMVPTTNTVPSKRFAVQQDVLEMLVRGAVAPNEGTVDLPSLRERFRDRYGIVVGGGPQDEQDLMEYEIHQADATALAKNGERFAARLRSLDFARLLADGVLQVRMERARASA